MLGAYLSLQNSLKSPTRSQNVRGGCHRVSWGPSKYCSGSRKAGWTSSTCLCLMGKDEDTVVHRGSSWGCLLPTCCHLSWVLKPQDAPNLPPYDPQQQKSSFFKGALVHISQPLRENEGRWESPTLVGYTKPRSFLSPKYTKGPFQIQATKYIHTYIHKGRCESGSRKGPWGLSAQYMGINTLKAFLWPFWFYSLHTEKHKTQNTTPVRCYALNYLQAAESQYIRLLTTWKLKIKNMLERWLNAVPKMCL